LSLRESLRKIGEPKPGKAIPAFRSGFHSAPESLKAAMHAMNPPLIEGWLSFHEGIFENLEWTEECQGITTDGNSFYVVKNKKDENDWDIRAVYKFSREFTLLGRTLFPHENHIGSPTYYSGRIYVPIDGTTSIWILDTNLNDRGIFELGKNENGSFLQPGSVPWCAINPWNGYLYSSIAGDDEASAFGVDRVYAYDLSGNKFAFMGELPLEGGIMHRVQSGCFSKNGHLYLAADSYSQDGQLLNGGEIRSYSALNGAFLGSLRLLYDRRYWPGEAEELECIWIDHWTHDGGDSTYVHVLILDNDGNQDDVFLRHYTVPDPTLI
jgi:hypothetical protein